LLILKQFSHQFLARVLFLLQFLRRGLRRKQHLGFDMNKRRSHHQEFSRDMQVQKAHQLYILQILLGNFGNGYIADIKMVFLDQIQKQIQRAFKNI
jgi:hypothetical protein